MANKTINTRIVLRNDYLSAWNNSDKKLLKGEVALALREDGKYEVRVGAGDKSWKELSANGNIVLSANNILGLENYINTTVKDTNTTYKIVSTALTGSETGSSFVLQSHELSDTAGKWTAVEGSRFNVPAFDSDSFKTEIVNEIAIVSADTLKQSKDYTNTEIRKVNDAIKDGVHFIGKVDSKTSDGYTVGETTTAAKNGDIIIIDKAEYIYSSALSSWQELGDEGTIASQTYVDNAANTAKADAIKATQNKVTEVASESALPAEDNVAGDIAVVKTQIGTTGKYQYKGFVWTGTAWQAMDGDYSTEHVILPADMTITYALGKYTIPTSGSLKLNCAGKTLKEFLDDAFAETRSGNVTNPAFTLAAGGDKTGEIGTTYVLPAATLTMTNVGSYQYGPATGITVPVGQATVKCTTTGYTDVTKSNTVAMKKDSTLATDAGTTAITYLSTAASYTFTSEATYTDGAVPKNNIGGDDTAKQIKSAKDTKSVTVTYAGQYPVYYAFTTTPTSNPTAITANNGNVTASGVTYTRTLNNFSITSFTASGKWYELFYLIPTGKHASWSGKDSNNVDLAVEAKTQATVTFMNGSTATYDVFVVRNAAQYSATTCKMTFK